VPVDFELLSTNNGILAFEMCFATGEASRINRELAETGPEIQKPVFAEFCNTQFRDTDESGVRRPSVSNRGH
jgi:hypothetical protein